MIDSPPTGHTDWPPRLWGAAGLVLSATVGGLSGLHPTGLVVWDGLLAAFFGALMTLAVSVSPRWVWFVALAATAGFAASTGWALVAIAGLVAALALEMTRSTWWPLRLGIGVTVAQGLFHLDVGTRFGWPSVAAAAVSTIVLIAAVSSRPPSQRRRCWRAAGLLTLGSALAVLLIGIAALRAAPELTEGSEAARAGLESARNGEVELATSQLDQAVTSLDRADRRLNSWWTEPAGLVPVVGQHLRAARVSSNSATSVAEAAAVALADADIDQLKVSSGAIDLALVSSMAGPLAAMEQSLTSAIDDIERVQSPWLLPSIDRRLDDVVVELTEALPDARKAADATRLLPSLLGREEPRHYLVLFATPAEARELGGIVGNVVELTVDNGRVSIARQMRNADLNSAGPGRLGDRETYPSRFLINRPEVFSQNWSGMTDLPSVARAVADLYPTMGGREIDGVLYVDPYGIAALMQFTGAVEVPEIGRTLDAESVVPFLLVEQYQTFDEEDRIDFLDRIAVTTFSRLLSADLPSPRRLGDVLGPAARQGRLQMATFDESENDFLRTLFLLGELPHPDGSDHLAVVHANGGSDKLDGFLQRTITYDAVVDPLTGSVSAKVTVELRNNVPAGLPDYVIGDPNREVPQATNRVHLSVYSPHELVALLVDSAPVDPELQQELGYQRYLTFVDVAPGQTVTVVFELSGVVDLIDGVYRLTVAPQATANPDRLILEVKMDQDQLAFDDLVLEDTTFELSISDSSDDGVDE